MLKRHAGLRMLPILLIVAVLSAACDVPDISEFTKQSAEMTRGIRTGVKDTENLIKSASQRSDLYPEATRKALKQSLKNYKAAIKPTVDTLDALDAYLEALNALSQANKKSEENSKGAVNAVVGLVTAVSGLTFASSTINVATGLVTLAEEFRTAKDFKKRVNLAAEIVEGKFEAEKDAAGIVVLDAKGKPKLMKTCVSKAEDRVTEASGRIKKLVTDAMKRADDAAVTAPQKQALAQQKEALDQILSPKERREKMRAFGIITDAELAQIKAAELTIGAAGCGVIDLLKFNINDLKAINEALSTSLAAKIKDKNNPILSSHDSTNTRRNNIRAEIGRIAATKNLVTRISEMSANDADPLVIMSRKRSLKANFTDLFTRDPQLKTEVLDALEACGISRCGRMRDALTVTTPAGCASLECMKPLTDILAVINPSQFDRSAAVMLDLLDVRKGELAAEDETLADDLERLRRDYDAVMNDLKLVTTKGDQLDALLTTSVSALKAWADSHANLRVAVNTKKPLTVAKLTSEVREIWGIINPEKK